MTEIKGIDISQHNGDFNLQNAKKQGYNFVIARAGYTGYGDGISKAKDTQFENNYAKAKAIGMPIGCYYFTIATSYQKGVDEANWLYNNCLKGKQFEYPIAIDVENDTGKKYYLQKAGREATTNGVKGFCETIEKLGYYVTIYGSDVATFADLIYPDQLSKYDKWVARYQGKKPSVIKQYGIWQYDDNGVDKNIAYKDYPAIIKSKGLNGFGKGTPVPPTSAPQQPSNPAPIQNSSSVYVVQKGDGLIKIGQKLGKDWHRIASDNGIQGPNYTIYAGQKLNIYGAGTSAPKPVSQSYSTYKIQKGDSLIKISKKLGKDWHRIASDNNIKGPNYTIYAGKTLKIYK